MSSPPTLSVEKSQELENLLITISMAQRINGSKPIGMPVPTYKERIVNPQCISIELRSIPIAGFELGGERRVCVPQLVASLLHKIDLDRINIALTKLRIHTHMCDQGQLRALKHAGILMVGADSCPLMTISDAERLLAYCNKNYMALSPHQPNCSDLDLREAVPVYHQCFGGADGELIPDLYTSADAPIIKCNICRLLFSTTDFVLHTHVDELEASVCHWGFDSHNWRSYLHLCANVKDREKLKLILKAVKDRFDDATTSKAVKRQAPPINEHQATPKKVAMLESAVPSDEIIKKLISNASMTLISEIDGKTKEADAAQTLVAMSRKASITSDAEQGKNYKKSIIQKFEAETKRRESLEKDQAEQLAAVAARKAKELQGNMNTELEMLLARYCPSAEGKQALRAYFDHQKSTHDAQYAELSLTQKVMQQNLAENRLLLLAQSHLGLTTAPISSNAVRSAFTRR